MEEGVYNLNIKSKYFSGIKRSRLKFSLLGSLTFLYIFYAMTSYWYSATKIIPFAVGAALQITVLTMLLLRLLMNINSLKIYSYDIIWLLFYFYIVFECLYYGYNAYTLAYTVVFLFSIVAKSDIKLYRTAFNTIKVFSIIYALGTIFQYLLPNLWLKYIYPIFREDQQKHLYSWFVSRSRFPGITNQVGHTAGYLIVGIGLVLCFWSVDENKKQYKKNAIILILMIIALFLTRKRAHFLFGAASFFVVYWFSRTNITKRLKVVLGSILLLIILIVVSQFVEPTSMLGKIRLTFIGIFQGDDISSGRSYLYKVAFTLFKENPLFGIGFKGFKTEFSQGLLNNDNMYDVHNVYLQLLAENGIIGFLLFVVPSLMCLIKTINSVKKTRRKKGTYLYAVSLYSLYLQVFFLLYCLTGNPLYDFNYLYIYFFAVTIGGAVSLRINRT